MNEQDNDNKNAGEMSTGEQASSSTGQAQQPKKPPRLSLRTAIKRATSKRDLKHSPSSPANSSSPFLPLVASPTTPTASHAGDSFSPILPGATDQSALELQTLVNALLSGFRIGATWSAQRREDAIKNLESVRQQMMQRRLDKRVIVSSTERENDKRIETILNSLKETQRGLDESSNFSPTAPLRRSSTNLTEASEPAEYDDRRAENAIKEFLVAWGRKGFARGSYEPSPDELKQMQEKVARARQQSHSEAPPSTTNPIEQLQKLPDSSSIADVKKIVSNVKEIGEHQNGHGTVVEIFANFVLIQESESQPDDLEDDFEKKIALLSVPHHLFLDKPYVEKLVSFCSPGAFNTIQQLRDISAESTVDDISDHDLGGIKVREASEREKGRGEIVIALENSAWLLMKPRSQSEKPHLVRVAGEQIEKDGPIRRGMQVSFGSAIDYTIDRLKDLPEFATIDEINRGGELVVKEVDDKSIGKGVVVKILSNSVLLQIARPHNSEEKPPLLNVASIRVLGKQELGNDVSFCSALVANTIERFKEVSPSTSVDKIAKFSSGMTVREVAEGEYGGGIVVKELQNSALIQVHSKSASDDPFVINVPRTQLKEKPVLRKPVSFYTAIAIRNVVRWNVKKALLDTVLDARETSLREKQSLQELRPALLKKSDDLIAAMEGVSLPAKPSTDALFQLVSEIGSATEPADLPKKGALLTKECEVLFAWAQSLPSHSTHKETLEAQSTSLLDYAQSIVDVTKAKKAVEGSEEQVKATEIKIDSLNKNGFPEQFQAFIVEALPETPSTDELFKLMAEIRQTTEPSDLSEKGELLRTNCETLLASVKSLPPDSANKQIFEAQSVFLLNYAKSVVDMAENIKALGQSTEHFETAQSKIKEFNSEQSSEQFQALMEQASPTKPNTERLRRLVLEIQSINDPQALSEKGALLKEECAPLLTWAESIPHDINYDKKALKKQSASLLNWAEAVVNLPATLKTVSQNKEWAKSAQNILDAFNREPSSPQFSPLVALAEMRPLDIDVVTDIEQHVNENRNAFTAPPHQNETSYARLIMDAAMIDKLLEAYKVKRDLKTVKIVQGFNDANTREQLEKKIAQELNNRSSGSSPIFYTMEYAKRRLGRMVEQETLLAATVMPPPAKSTQKLQDTLSKALTPFVQESTVFGHEFSGQTFTGKVKEAPYRDGDELVSLQVVQKMGTHHIEHNLDPLKIKFVDEQGKTVRLEPGQKYVFTLPKSLHLMKEEELYKHCMVTSADDYFSKKKNTELVGKVCQIANGAGPAKKGSIYVELPGGPAQFRKLVVCPPEKKRTCAIGDEVTCTLTPSTTKEISKKSGRKF
ncbi:MAG: hypothetical protein V4568_14445 [Pseudomonadota bacterium]